MAYFSQEKKKELAPAVKQVLAKYGIKGTMAVRHYSTFVLNLSSGKIDFIENFFKTNQHCHPRQAYLQVNPYWYKEHFSGEAKECIHELVQAMNNGNHDRSDIQSDHFDVGWYIDINIGSYNKPYRVT